MPRIIVTADGSGDRVLHSERVTQADFETEHFRAQFAERVAWAVEDAEREGPASGAVAAPPPAQAAADSEAGTRAPAHAV